MPYVLGAGIANRFMTMGRGFAVVTDVIFLGLTPMAILLEGALTEYPETIQKADSERPTGAANTKSIHYPRLGRPWMVEKWRAGTGNIAISIRGRYRELI